MLCEFLLTTTEKKIFSLIAIVCEWKWRWWRKLVSLNKKGEEEEAESRHEEGDGCEMCSEILSLSHSIFIVIMRFEWRKEEKEECGKVTHELFMIFMLSKYKWQWVFREKGKK